MQVTGHPAGEGAASPSVAPARPDERPAPTSEASVPAGEGDLADVVAAAEAPTDSWSHWGKLGLGALLIVLVTFVVLAVLNAPA